MNLASLLLCLVFAVVGYFVHPMMLPQLVEAGVVSETALGGKKLNKEDLNSAVTDKPITGSNDKTEKPVSHPDVSPRIIDEPVVPDSDGDLNDPLIDPSPAPVEIPAQELTDPKLPEPLSIPAQKTPDPVKPAPSVAPSFSNSELIQVMKQSVRNKEVKEFSYENALSWLSSGEEQINGQTYQVGEVIYKESTIFGDQTLKAKALFQDRKLIKWVWPTTNSDMK